MGFVFIFLVFLVFAVKTMSHVLGRFHVEPTPLRKRKCVLPNHQTMITNS
ncbi:OadG family transporter subunit [Vibrio parahaemolyticus]|nr:OadG family transporter subunit [Vibrio parahaemolyticus]MDN4715593.1 OadG family transporter subunit [Vibrio parahaemolyticus]MDN4719604.1 OadG family transporter subunit [Vibrio parahaemolyticus]MDN4723384.1 OadG family transporter subunit [Vibrio parahaemolyticus]MDN4727755.1 OadG family transporter subunit [Vibrio parahaemolyticus]